MRSPRFWHCSGRRVRRHRAARVAVTRYPGRGWTRCQRLRNGELQTAKDAGGEGTSHRSDAEGAVAPDRHGKFVRERSEVSRISLLPVWWPKKTSKLTDSTKNGQHKVIDGSSFAQAQIEQRVNETDAWLTSIWRTFVKILRPPAPLYPTGLLVDQTVIIPRFSTLQS